MSVNFIYLIRYFAENVGHDSDNVVAVYLKSLSLHLQPMIVINIRAYSFFYCLKLRQDALRPANALDL